MIQVMAVSTVKKMLNHTVPFGTEMKCEDLQLKGNSDRKTIDA
jgi:hypothetical protein